MPTCPISPTMWIEKRAIKININSNLTSLLLDRIIEVIDNSMVRLFCKILCYSENMWPGLRYMWHELTVSDLILGWRNSKESIKAHVLTLLGRGRMHHELCHPLSEQESHRRYLFPLQSSTFLLVARRT